MTIFESYEEASAACTDSEFVCGTLLKNGAGARYFAMAADTPDDIIRDRCFEIREGRPLGEYERALLHQVLAGTE